MKSKHNFAMWILAAVLIFISGLAVLFGCAPAQVEEKRTVTFMNGDEIFNVQFVDLGEKYEFPAETPTREQPDEEHIFEFVGWTLDPNYYEYRSEILEETDYVVSDLVIYAAFRTVKISDLPDGGADLEYNVEFRMPRGEDFGSLSGTTISSCTVKRYGSAAKPAEDEMPQITGYHFTGEWEGGTLTDIRGHRRVTAVYEKNIYNYVWHYLDETRSVEVEFRDPVDLTQTPQVSSAFVFDGWFMDEDRTVKAALSEVPAQDLHLYAKYHVDFSTASVTTEGDMVYGDEANKFYVSGLSYAEGLQYTFVWTVNGNSGAATEESRYPVKNAGVYNVGVHIFADYHNGVLMDEGDASDENDSRQFTIELQKATLSAEVTLNTDSVVYGSPAPVISEIVYSGFRFGETQEDVGVTQTFIYRQDGADVTGTKLHVGSYTIETVPGELPNYKFAAIDSPAFTVTQKDLTVTMSVDDYGYGEGFAPEIGFSGFEYEEDENVLGGHWFTLADPAGLYTADGNGIFHEQDLIHAGNHAAVLNGYASEDYNVILPNAAQFTVAKRAASATLSAEGGVYGVIPQIEYSFENVLEDDKQRFVSSYAYTRNGNAYNPVEQRFIVGSYNVVATFTETGFADYEQLPAAEDGFTITQKELKVTAQVAHSYVYGEAIQPEAKFEQGAFEFGENENTPDLVQGAIGFTYRTADGTEYVLNRHTVNDYTVEVKGISSLNYKFIIEKTGFTVTPAELLLTVRLASDSILYGEVPAPSAEEGCYRGVSYSGFVYDDSVVSVFGVGDSLPSITYMQNGEEAESFHAGTYVATTSANPKNYNVTVKTATLTVNPRTLYVGVALGGASLVYGNKPVASVYYEKEGYDGFYGGEQDLYTAGAYVEYAGDVTYTQSELGMPESKMVVGAYLLSVKGIGNLKDYVITYGHEETPVSFEITPKELTVTASAEGFTYGERELPAPALSYSGFVYGENEDVLGGVPVYFYTRDGEEYQSVYFDAGNYAVSVSALTSANYCFKFVSGNFTVIKRNAAVTVSATGATYGDVPTVTHSSTVLARDVAGFGFEYVYTFSRAAANDYSAYNPDDYVYYQAGNYRVTVGYTQNQNYNPLQVNVAAFGISKKQIEVGVTNVNDSYVYGSVPAPALTFKGFVGNENEFTDGIFTAQPESSLSYTTAQGYGTTASRLNAGNYFVAAAEGYVSANYRFVYEEKTPFAVTAKPLTVTVSVNDITYGEVPAPKLGYTEFAYDETASALSGSVIYEYGGEKSANGYYRAGEHTVEVSGLSSENYQITFVGDTFTVNKRSLDVGVSVDNFVYGGVPAPELTFGGFAAGESSDDLAGELTYSYSGNLANGVYHAGEYRVEIGGYTSGDYAITFTGNTFTVTPKDLTFSLSVGDIGYGENPVPRLTYSGFIEGEDLKNLGGELVYDYSGEKSASGYYRAGEHILTVYGYTSTDYAITYPQGVAFTVSPRNVTLALKGGWDTYAKDPADYEWFTFGGDEILGNELVFSVSATHNGQDYVINSEKYFSVGDYVITVSRNKNDDYVVMRGGSVVEEQASLSFTVAQKPITISVNGDSEPWAKRADWSYKPSISDDRFTLEGIIVLNKDREIGAATYNETSIGQTFTWQNGFSIKADGKVVTENFAISYILQLTLSNSSFSVKVPENTEYVYNAVERSFPVTATADGISAGDITREYRVGDSGSYSKVVPTFTNAGEYKVYYKVSAQNTEPAEGDFTVKISKAEISVIAPNDITAKFNAQDHFVGLTKVGGVEADKTFNGSITYGKAKEDCSQNALTVINVADSCTVHYKVTAGENYNEATGSYTITINKADLTVTKPSDVATDYDKSNHFAAVEQVAGVSDDKQFAFAVTYGKSANQCTETSLSLINVKDSGTVYYKVTAGENYNESTGSYTVTISKAVVAVPQIAHKTYNKENQTATVEESALYTVKTNEGGTSAGEYQVVLALADSENYKWNTSENAELTLYFVIDRAKLSKPLASEDEFKYNSESHIYIPKGFVAETMTVNGNEQIFAGEHTVTVNIADKQNYEWADGNQDELTFAFRIAKADYNVAKVGDATGLVYNNTQQGRSLEELKALISVYGSDGFEVEFTSASTAVKAGAIPVSYRVFGNDNYNDYKGSYQLTIDRATPKVTLPEESRTLTYDATKRNDVFAAALGYADTYADDDCTVKFGVEKSEESGISLVSEIVWFNSLAEAMDIRNAGTYIIHVQISGANYNTVEESFPVTINKAEASINTEGVKKEYTYNGALQTVASGATHIGDGTLTYSGNTFKDVPKDGKQTVTVTLSEGENYLGASAQFEIIINRAPLSLGTVAGISGLTFNGGDQYSENGSNIYSAVSGAVAEETAQNAIKQIIYAQIECKNAGEHTVNFELTASANYQFPEGENKGSYTITINKANLTVTKPSDVETDYDKLNHFAKVEQVEGVADDSEFAFAVSYGRSADKCTEESLSFVSVSDSGAAYYKVTAGENYNEATGSYNIKINRKAVTVTLPKDIKGTYNGTEYGGAGITIDVDEDVNDIATVSYEVQGGSTTKTAPVFTDAISKTTVTVTAISTSNNYIFKSENGNFSGAYTVEISKATLSVTQGDITDYYNGKNKFAAITADQIGGLVSGDKFSVTYSTTQMGQYDSVELSFVNVKDTGDVWYKVTAGKNYEELNSSYKITINPAQLNASHDDLTATYNGANQFVGLTGANVTGIIEEENSELSFSYSKEQGGDYKGGLELINVVDSCTIYFKVTTEDKNYADATGSYKITINKAPLAKPTADTTVFTYTGADQTYNPVNFNAETMTISGNSQRNANESGYTVTVSLSDPANYEWSGENKDDPTFNFVINRKALAKPTAVDGQAFTYNGEEQEFKLNNFELATMTVEGNKRTNAEYGSATQVVVKLRDTQNYKWSDGTDGNLSFDFTIDRATRTVDNLPEIPEQVKKLVVREKLSQVDFGRFGLPDGMRWVNAETPLKVGTNDYDVVIDEDENYYSYNGKISITVRKQTVTVQLNNVTPIEEDFGGTTIDFNTTLKSKFLAEGIDYILLNEEGRELTSAELELFPGLTNPTITCNGTIDKGGTYLITYSFNFTENDYFIGDGTSIEGYTYLKVKSVEVGGTLYTIEDALAVVNGTITVKYNTAFATLQVAELAGYSEAGGNYTVRTGVTLLLPYDGATGVNTTNTAKASSYGKSKTLELIIPDNITLINQGTISIGGITTGQQGYAGGTAGDYAQITLGKNAIIDSYGDINAYGFIDESSDNNGSQVIMNNGTLLMPFIVVEHRGGTQFVDMIGGSGKASNPDLKTSPFNSFYLENIHSKLTVISGAKIVGHANLYANDQDNTTDIDLVGTSGCLINLKTGTKLIIKFSLIKTENGNSDKVINMEIRGSATMNSLTLELDAGFAKPKLTTEKVHFPISWHYQIMLSPYENGNVSIVDTTSQKLKLLPGASLTVSKGVTLNVSELVVYDETSISDISDPAHGYEKKNEKAILIVNGNLNAQTLAGFVQSQQDDAVVSVVGNSIVTQELTKNTTLGKLDVLLGQGHKSEYKSITTKLTGLLNGGATAEELAVGAYVSQKGTWYPVTKYIEYTITYEANNGNLTGNESDNFEVPALGSTASVSYANTSDPVREFYTFTGWYVDAKCTMPLADYPFTVTENQDNFLTVYAGWKKTIYDIVYIVDFAGEDSAYINKNAATWSVGDVISLVDASHANKDLQFKGWFSDPSYEKQVTEVSGNNISELLHEGIIVIFGYFENANKAYDVVFDAAGITGYNNLPATPEGITVKIGGTLGENFPTGDFTVNDNDVTKQYYFGGGWTAKGKAITKDTPIDASYLTDGKLVVTAVWEEKVVLTINITATGKSGSMLGKGNDITEELTVSFSDYIGNLTQTVKGEGGAKAGLFGSNPGKTAEGAIIAYLKTGQTYTIDHKCTGGKESIQGNLSGTAGAENITVTITAS